MVLNMLTTVVSYCVAQLSSKSRFEFLTPLLEWCSVYEFLIIIFLPSDSYPLKKKYISPCSFPGAIEKIYIVCLLHYLVLLLF